MNRRPVRKIGIVLLLLGVLSTSGALAAQATKVDLNTADQKELETLPGIGPALAERILQFRAQNGPFERVEDLMNVRGIGEKKFLKLKEFITVTPSASKAKKSQGG